MPRVSGGWTFKTIEDESGEFVLTPSVVSDSLSDDWVPAHGETVFVADEAIATAAADDRDVACIGEFKTASREASEIRLILQGELTPEIFDAFFTGSGSFRLYASDPQAWPSHYASNLANKQIVPAETFLIIDPLVSLSTAIASRSWVWSLISAGAILIVCILIPRGFCGYLCPLGTTIDLFDWAIAGRTKRFRVPGDGWWVHIKYYLLAGTLVAAVCGVLVSGDVLSDPDHHTGAVVRG